MKDAKDLFLDTSVLVYAIVEEAPYHHRALHALQSADEAGRTLWVSRQVLREFMVIVTQAGRIRRPLSGQDLLERLWYLESRFQVAEEGPGVTEKLLDLVAGLNIRGSKIHNANIVATMQANGISCLLTRYVLDYGEFNHLIDIETI